MTLGLAWITDPTMWAGLLTLVVLEIVLGIDNLVFVAILADRLPAGTRDRARVIGLSMALVQRLILLACMSWLVGLTEPLVTVLGAELSARDLLLLGGGFFLLYKATSELHERLEGGIEREPASRRGAAAFWPVVAQIVVLDAVFSLDSIITAVAMVNELAIMMIAVVISILLMMVASRPLGAFINAHRTVVILCLSFLLMIGFSLVVDAFGVHVPKGYLYAAIAFSIVIEVFNQVAVRNRRAHLRRLGDLRDRTAEVVLRLLGGVPREPEVEAAVGEAVSEIMGERPDEAVFEAAEKSLVRRVLDLAGRSARSIMTPRTELDWLDIGLATDVLQRRIFETGRSRYLVARGSLDELIGVAEARDLFRDLVETGRVDPERSVRAPLFVPETTNVLRLLDRFRRRPISIAVVLDEYGSVEGIVTRTDIFEAIAGEFPDGDAKDAIARQPDGAWLIDASMDVRHVSEALGRDLVPDADEYSTLAGFVLWEMRRMPSVGDAFVRDGLRYEITAMDGRRIDRVLIITVEEAAAG